MRVHPIVLAAGKGTRMRSRTPKVLHTILGVPMLSYVLAAVGTATDEVPVVVVGHGREQVEAACADTARFVTQAEPRGTADAVAAALEALPEEGAALIVYGDVPLLDGAELLRLTDRFRGEKGGAMVVAVSVADPSGYGRVLTGEGGVFRGIVEERDAGEAERAVRLVNAGVYLVSLPLLRRFVARVGADNAQGERYLPDVFTLMAREGVPVQVVEGGRAEDYMGVNDRRELAEAARTMRRRILRRWMERGVGVEDPESTHVGPLVELAEDVELRPFTFLLGRTRVERGSVIGPMSRLVDAEVGEGAEVLASFVEGARVGDRARVGPFAHLRPGTVVEEEALVGNFAEVKNTRIGRRTRVHHHCYLGDADLGEGVNVGAGAITVNYDGRAKHRTVVGPGGFIGCNVNLIAPVVVGEGAYVAAGSTVNQDVPPRALAIARERQRNVSGWVDRRRSKEGDPG